MTNLVQVPSFSGYGGATLHLDIDQVEHQRRQNHKVRAITDPGVLDTLMSLPVGLPVPLGELTFPQRHYALHAPAGILTIEDTQVTRHAIRPCRIALATVRSATACKTALESASRFAPFCARTVIVKHRPTMPETLIEFDFWGIGITLEHPDGATEPLVQPRPWRPQRHTVAGWRYAETAYSAYLTHSPAAERTTR